MAFGSLAGAGHCRPDAHPGCAQPVPKSQLLAPPLPQLLISGLLWEAGLWLLGGYPRVWGAFGHPPPPHEVGREVQGGEAAWLGAQIRWGQSPASPSGSWHLPHRSLAPWQTGEWKRVRLQVWAPPEGDPTGALPPGSSLGRREPSRQAKYSTCVRKMEHDQFRGSGCEGRGSSPRLEARPHKEESQGTEVSETELR